jgi:hypothetical protein
MIVLRACGLLVLATAACGGTEVKDFVYGGGQPGFGKPEGGEIRHEHVRFLGQPDQTWLMVYQYTAQASVPSATFGAPEMNSTGQFENCVDERDPATQTWPFKPITGAMYLDLPQVKLSGPGIAGSLTVPKGYPEGTEPNTTGNSTFRSYAFTYGGGVPDPDSGHPLGFNATLTAAMSTTGGAYVLDIGKPDSAPGGSAGTAMTYFMPETYRAPLQIGEPGTVPIPAHVDLEMSWAAPKNDKGPDGATHTKKTYFNVTLFADQIIMPAGTVHPQFICFADVDGYTRVPATVIDLLPLDGLIVHANLSHWMELRDTMGGEQRRFDLVSVYSNLSAYSKQ